MSPASPALLLAVCPLYVVLFASHWFFYGGTSFMLLGAAQLGPARVRALPLPSSPSTAQRLKGCARAARQVRTSSGLARGLLPLPHLATV